jgi:NAD(P)-dependent dehydrogenase (short-subunit alcohol dehydrogenase family)
VNLKGPYRLAARIGARMKQDGRGSIINVSSIAAVDAVADRSAVRRGEAGLNNLTIALARVFAPEVRVNCIMPGPFLTDISKAWGPEATARLEGGDSARPRRPADEWSAPRSISRATPPASRPAP